MVKSEHHDGFLVVGVGCADAQHVEAVAVVDADASHRERDPIRVDAHTGALSSSFSSLLIGLVSIFEKQLDSMARCGSDVYRVPLIEDVFHG